jgi:invasion protein IalB
MARSFLIGASLGAMLVLSAVLPAHAQQPGAQPGARPTPEAAQPGTAAPGTGAAPKGPQPQAPSPNAQGGPTAQGGPNPQGGNVRGNHGAWSIICDRPAGSSVDQCALMQNVIAEDRPEVGLSVVVLKTADRKARILRILAPLGVLLKDGMELYVDNNNIGRAYFTRCFSEGCYVEVEIDEELMRIMRAGKNAVFALRESTDQDRVGIPVELTGFGEGYDALP